MSIVATHIDSPNLRVRRASRIQKYRSDYNLIVCINVIQVRPVSKKTKFGYLQVGVETYGGGIWHSWFDRDLSLAGRVVLANQDGSYVSKLVKIDRPLLRIPTLAIHRKQVSFESCDTQAYRPTTT